MCLSFFQYFSLVQLVICKYVLNKIDNVRSSDKPYIFPIFWFAIGVEAADFIFYKYLELSALNTLKEGFESSKDPLLEEF